MAVLLVPACAAAQGESPRQSYILAHDHGWVELTIADVSVPAHPVQDDSGRPTFARPDCSLELKLSDERFLAETLTPAGAAPPYRVDSGFRFAAPTGLLAASLTYRGCRDSTAPDVTVSFPVVVDAGRVTQITFDGSLANAKVPASDTAVTLESLDARLQEIERRMPK